jgi:hypothetical protein
MPLNLRRRRGILLIKAQSKPSMIEAGNRIKIGKQEKILSGMRDDVVASKKKYNLFISTTDGSVK